MSGPIRSSPSTISFRIRIDSSHFGTINLPSSSTYGNLLQKIVNLLAERSILSQLGLREHPNIFQEPQSSILFGFPPRVLNDIPMEAVLENSQLSGGGNLIVRLKPATVNSSCDEKSLDAVLERKCSSEDVTCLDDVTTESKSPSWSAEHVLKLEVPADNSCLFRSLIFLLDCPVGGIKAITESDILNMRLLAASLVQSNPDLFSDAVLGMPVAKYCQWITDTSKWGGYIELTAVAHAYNVTIFAIDIRSLRVEEYNGGGACDKCCYVIYNGIHYDPLVIANNQYRECEMKKLFSCTDKKTYAVMQDFAHELHSLRQFTNVEDFALMCLDCHKGLIGQKQAREHSQETGHYNFCEVEQTK